MVMFRSVYDSIVNTVGSKKPECGGVLGASTEGIISEYYFDTSGKSEDNAYLPDVNEINRVLESWHENDIHMVGIIHSHNANNPVPSCGDISYGIRILQALDYVSCFYLPILVRDEMGIKLHGYVIRQNNHRFVCERTEIIIMENERGV